MEGIDIYRLIFLIFGIFLMSPFEGQAKTEDKLDITFVCPCTTERNPYWDRFISFLESAAKGLDINLKVAYAGLSRAEQLSHVISEIRKQPDYIITMPINKYGHKVLAETTLKKVPMMLINADIIEQDKSKVGSPRQQYPYWLGLMAPDDVKAGYDLAIKLISEARSKKTHSKDGKIHLIAITGYSDSSFVRYRLEGLKKAVAEQNDVVLRQILPTVWQDESLDKKTQKLIQRFPDVSVFWSVTSEQAVSIVSAIKQSNKHCGKDILVGSIDWTSQSIQSLLVGEKNVSVGGHFMEGARALIMLYDHSNGLDFGPEKLHYHRTLDILTSDNIAKFVDILDEHNWHRIDFKKLSKTHNKDLSDYSFKIADIIKHFSENKASSK